VDVTSGAFWAALGSIMLANLVLSGDNAIVIAMAAESLPPPHQRRALVWGSAAAIGMRLALTAVAVAVLQWPYVRLVAAVLLLYIGTTLLRSRHDAAVPAAAAADGVASAIRTILLADLVMSLDNVLAMVAAADGDLLLLALGLLLSIPLIVFGSTLLLRIMRRWPVIKTLGAALLGVLAAQMLLGDPVVVDCCAPGSTLGRRATELLAAVGVVAVGRWRGRRRPG
jgi:YjbE family integral membrane protein